MFDIHNDNLIKKNRLSDGTHFAALVSIPYPIHTLIQVYATIFQLPPEPDLLTLHHWLEFDPQLSHRPVRSHPELGPCRFVLTPKVPRHKPELARNVPEFNRMSKNGSTYGGTEAQGLLQ